MGQREVRIVCALYIQCIYIAPRASHIFTHNVSHPMLGKSIYCSNYLNKYKVFQAKVPGHCVSRFKFKLAGLSWRNGVTLDARRRRWLHIVGIQPHGLHQQGRRPLRIAPVCLAVLTESEQNRVNRHLEHRKEDLGDDKPNEDAERDWEHRAAIKEW